MLYSPFSSGSSGCLADWTVPGACPWIVAGSGHRAAFDSRQSDVRRCRIRQLIDGRGNLRAASTKTSTGMGASADVRKTLESGLSNVASNIFTFNL